MDKPKNPAAVALGKLGGKAKSPAKAAACRENGAKNSADTDTRRKRMLEAIERKNLTTLQKE
ncbi:MAG: hypothetical protein WC373_15180 [Smithella sp.]|jgi:hypothetical protein